MPKRVKQKRKTLPDPNQWAHRMVQASTGESPTVFAPDFKTQMSAYMSKLGKKGGKVSGQRRMTNLTDEQRREIASKAARAMWAKRRAT